MRPLGQRGILLYSCHKERVPGETYNNLVRFSARLEAIALAYLPPEVIRFIAAAKDAVPFATMKGIDLDQNEEPKFYCSIACGLNLVLSSHIDDDFMYCVVVAFNMDYTPKNRERTLVYFTFPGLGQRGMAVTMRHGQVVIFNARQVCSWI